VDFLHAQRRAHRSESLNEFFILKHLVFFLLLNVPDTSEVLLVSFFLYFFHVFYFLMNLHRVIKMGYLYFFLCPQLVMLSLDPCFGLLKNVIIILKVSLQQEVSYLVMGIALP